MSKRHKHCRLRMCAKNHEGITCHPNGKQCEYYIPPPKKTSSKGEQMSDISDKESYAELLMAEEAKNTQLQTELTEAKRKIKAVEQFVADKITVKEEYIQAMQQLKQRETTPENSDIYDNAETNIMETESQLADYNNIMIILQP